MSDHDDLFGEDGMPRRCISSIHVGSHLYWCENDNAGHDGLCSASDDNGGYTEWRYKPSDRFRS